MSRIGRRPIPVPAGVQFSATADGTVTVKGPKGTLTRQFHPDIIILQENGHLSVDRPSDGKMHRSLHGLTRTLLANMVEGVTNGYAKTLEIVGVGFRASVQGKILQMTVGYSHAVEVWPRDGIEFAVAQDPQTRNPLVTVSGIDKERVGQIAAEIRKLRKPEPYKGKGIRYKGEAIRRKQGKAGAKGGKGGAKKK